MMDKRAAAVLGASPRTGGELGEQAGLSRDLPAWCCLTMAHVRLNVLDLIA